jgi:hypothetical protein
MICLPTFLLRTGKSACCVVIYQEPVYQHRQIELAGSLYNRISFVGSPFGA